MDFLSYAILYCAGVAVVSAILAVLAKITDYLQDKMNELNRQVDEQLNNAEQ